VKVGKHVCEARVYSVRVYMCMCVCLGYKQLLSSLTWTGFAKLLCVHMCLCVFVCVRVCVCLCVCMCVCLCYGMSDSLLLTPS